MRQLMFFSLLKYMATGMFGPQKTLFFHAKFTTHYFYFTSAKLIEVPAFR